MPPPELPNNEDVEKLFGIEQLSKTCVANDEESEDESELFADPIDQPSCSYSVPGPSLSFVKQPIPSFDEIYHTDYSQLRKQKVTVNPDEVLARLESYDIHDEPGPSTKSTGAPKPQKPTSSSVPAKKIECGVDWNALEQKCNESRVAIETNMQILNNAFNDFNQKLVEQRNYYDSLMEHSIVIERTAFREFIETHKASQDRKHECSMVHLLEMGKSENMRTQLADLERKTAINQKMLELRIGQLESGIERCRAYNTALKMMHNEEFYRREQKYFNDVETLKTTIESQERKIRNLEQALKKNPVPAKTHEKFPNAFTDSVKSLRTSVHYLFEYSLNMAAAYLTDNTAEIMEKFDIFNNNNKPIQILELYFGWTSFSFLLQSMLKTSSHVDRILDINFVHQCSWQFIESISSNIMAPPPVQGTVYVAFLKIIREVTTYLGEFEEKMKQNKPGCMCALIGNGPTGPRVVTALDRAKVGFIELSEKFHTKKTASLSKRNHGRKK